MVFITRFIAQISYESFFKGLKDGFSLHALTYLKKLEIYCSSLLNQTDICYYRIGFMCGFIALILVFCLFALMVLKIIYKPKYKS